MQKVLASYNVARPTWRLGFQPSNTKYQEAGKGNSWQMLRPHASTSLSLLLKDENSLLTSGTGVAIAAHVDLSGGYIWKNIQINKKFHPGTAPSCEVKKWKRVYKCLRYWSKHVSGLYPLLLSDAVKLEKLPFHSKTWSLAMYFSNFILMQICYSFTSPVLIWTLIWRNDS